MEATLILKNTRTFTDGKIGTVRQDVAIGDGKVLEIVPCGELQTQTGKKTLVRDLTGHILLPGLCDYHTHFGKYCRSKSEIGLEGTDSLEDALHLTESRIPELADSQWILGAGWESIRWGSLPDKHSLDTFIPKKPAAFASKDRHSLWVNSAALELAGIDRDTPDPKGGVIMRDARGEPTGILKGTAVNLIRTLYPKPDVEQMKKLLETGIRNAHRLGLTALHSVGGSREFAALSELALEGKLKLRTTFFFTHPQQLYHSLLEQIGVRTPFGNRWLTIGGVKLYADGSLGSRTALMHQPYEGTDNYGIPVMIGEELEETVKKYSQAGLVCIVHAIGDRAVTETLNAFESVRKMGVGKKLLHRIEHSQCIRAEDVPRFTELGVIASMQPSHLFCDIAAIEQRWGSRGRNALPFRSLLNAGVQILFGSDAPVEQLSPMRGVYAAVTRTTPGGEPRGGWYPEQRIALPCALSLFCHQEDITLPQLIIADSVKVGMSADLTAFDEEILLGAPENLLNAEADMTVVDGKIVYERET